MKITPIRGATMSFFSVTFKCEKGMAAYQRYYNPRNTSEYRKIGGLDLARYKVADAVVNSNARTFNEIKLATGLTKLRTNETIEGMLRDGLLKRIDR